MTSPYRPEDWPSRFSQYLNAGDLEGVLALYELGATFVSRPGGTVVGRDGIRRVIGELIRSKTCFLGRVIKVVAVDDVALLYTNFQGTTVESSGETVEVRHRAIEVLRRQPDGTWKLIVGDPDGHGPHAVQKDG